MNFKKDAINSFLKGDVKLAKFLFSLYYKENKDNDCVFLMNLSELAIFDFKKAKKILELYLSKQGDEKYLKELEETLKSALTSYYFNKNSENVKYSEIAKLFEEKDFDEVFTALILNSSLEINSQKEVFAFINQLIENNHILLAYNLIERISMLYLEEEKINKLITKIKEYENKI